MDLDMDAVSGITRRLNSKDLANCSSVDRYWREAGKEEKSRRERLGRWIVEMDSQFRLQIIRIGSGGKTLSIEPALPPCDSKEILCSHQNLIVMVLKWHNWANLLVMGDPLLNKWKFLPLGFQDMHAPSADIVAGAVGGHLLLVGTLDHTFIYDFKRNLWRKGKRLKYPFDWRRDTRILWDGDGFYATMWKEVNYEDGVEEGYAEKFEEAWAAKFDLRTLEWQALDSLRYDTKHEDMCLVLSPQGKICAYVQWFSMCRKGNPYSDCVVDDLPHRLVDLESGEAVPWLDKRFNTEVKKHKGWMDMMVADHETDFFGEDGFYIWSNSKGMLLAYSQHDNTMEQLFPVGDIRRDPPKDSEGYVRFHLLYHGEDPSLLDILWQPDPKCPLLPWTSFGLFLGVAHPGLGCPRPSPIHKSLNSDSKFRGPVPSNDA